MEAERLPIVIRRYSTDSYPFRSLAEDILGEPLELLQDSASRALLTADNDQYTIFHKRWYADGWAQTQFHVAYREFLLEILASMSSTKKLLYQTIPTFRVHMPDNIAVGEFHKDTDYQHNPNEVNFWVPLTHAWDSNTIHIRVADQYVPIDVRYGEYLVFDGANTMHGNVVNTTGVARVSFDFRVLHKDFYNFDGAVSHNAHVPFNIGGYWSELCDIA